MTGMSRSPRGANCSTERSLAAARHWNRLQIYPCKGEVVESKHRLCDSSKQAPWTEVWHTAQTHLRSLGDWLRTYVLFGIFTGTVAWLLEKFRRLVSCRAQTEAVHVFLVVSIVGTR